MGNFQQFTIEDDGKRNFDLQAKSDAARELFGRHSIYISAIIDAKDGSTIFSDTSPSEIIQWRGKNVIVKVDGRKVSGVYRTPAKFIFSSAH